MNNSIIVFERIDTATLIASAGSDAGHPLTNLQDGRYATLWMADTAWVDLGQQFSQTQILSLAYLGNGIVVAGTGNSGKILRSTDYGTTWSDLGQQFSQTYISSFAYLGNGIVVAGTVNGGKILRSTDYGTTWSDLGQQFGQTYILSLAYLGNGIALAGTYLNGKILRSVDYGATWSDLGQQFSQTQILSLAYLGNGIVVAGTYNGGKILRSTDYGTTWSDLGQQFGQTDILSLAYLGNGIALAGTNPNAKILRSTNYSVPSGNQTLSIDYATARETNYILIAYHNLQLLGLTSLEIKGYYGDVLKDITSFPPVIFEEWTTDTPTTTNLLTFKKSSALSFAPEIGMIFIGKKVELPLYLNNPKHGLKSNLVRDESLSGLRYRTATNAERQTWKLDYGALKQVEIAEAFRWLRGIGAGLHPFWFRDMDGYWHFVGYDGDSAESGGRGNLIFDLRNIQLSEERVGIPMELPDGYTV